MKASVVDLRHKMREVLLALRRNEAVQILYHGKVAGTIVPAKKSGPRLRVEDHPFFGMRREAYRGKTVQKVMEELRGGRFRAL